MRRTGVGWFISALVLAMFLWQMASWSAIGRSLHTQPVSAQTCVDGEVAVEDGTCVPDSFFDKTDYCPVVAAMDPEARREYHATTTAAERQACADGESLKQEAARERADLAKQQEIDAAVQDVYRQANAAERQMEKGCY